MRISRNQFSQKRRIVTLVCFFVSCLFAIATPDGLWNGKRTPLETLKEGVAKKDPNSLAEWADCSRNGLPGIPYDPEVTFQYAKEAADLGSPYGMALVGRCYAIGFGTKKAPEKGLPWVRKSVAEDHPLGMKILANYYYSGAGGLKRSSTKYRDLTSKAADLGCIVAKGNRALGVFEGSSNFSKNQNAGLKEIIECMEVAETSYPATNFLVYVTDFPTHPLFTPEAVALAEGRVETSARAGSQESMSRLGMYYRDTGRPNKGLPLIIEAAKTPHSYASEQAYWAIYTSRNKARGGSIGQYSTLFHFARDAYKAGNRNPKIISSVAESYIQRWEKGFHEPDLALPYLEELIKMNDRKALGILAKLSATNTSKKAYDVERGRAIYIYLGLHDPHFLHALVDSYLGERPADRDLVKGYATTLLAMKRLSGGPLQKVTRHQKATLEKLTPEQKAKAEKLFEDDFPIARKFQEAARKTMIENGDLPKESKFKKSRR